MATLLILLLIILLLIGRGQLHIVEVKNPARNWKYEPSEQRLRERCFLLGVAYNTVETLEQAANLIGVNGGEQ